MWRFISTYCCFFIVSVCAYAYDLSGVVQDAAGAAAGGAKIYLLHGHSVQTQELQGGRFSFTGLEPGYFYVIAQNEVNALAGQSGFIGENTEVTLRMAAPGVITLRVVDTGFQPLPGARVAAVTISNGFHVPVEAFSEAGFPVFRSDDQGILRIPYLPESGFARIILRHIDYADSIIDYLPVQDEQQQVLMYPGVKANGRAMAEGGPVAGAVVRVIATGNGEAREVSQEKTDAEGFFNLRLRPGQYLITGHHPELGAPVPAALTIAEGSTDQTLEMAFAPLRAIRGSVLYPDGTPCMGAHVTYRAGEVPVSDTFTAVDGTFILRVPAPEGVLHIQTPPGFMMKELALIPVKLGEAMEAQLDPVRLEAIPNQTGVVLDDAAAPVPRAMVSSVNLPVPVYALTDETGEFSIRIMQDVTDSVVQWRVEHPDRFLRSEASIPLNETERQTITLAAYEPAAPEQPAPVRGNDLTSLLGQPAPALNAQQWFNGGAITIESLRGKVIALLFWGGFDTTAEGRDSVEQFRALHAMYSGAPDVAIVGVHDATSTQAEVTAFMEQYGVLFPVMLDAGRSESFGAYKVSHIPQVVLVDRKGNVRFYQTQQRIVELMKLLRREPE